MNSELTVLQSCRQLRACRDRPIREEKDKNLGGGCGRCIIQK
jgi:hypothetical protein